MLYFVPTPIGNLADISTHALEILTKCEIFICEDTRFSKKLLNLLSEKYQINFTPKEFYSLHTHNESEFFAKFDTLNFTQKNCAFLSYAGMPCISDPGIALVKFAQNNGIEYEILSGANALLLAVAASGIVEKEFFFLGFLPNTGKERKIAIENMLKNPYPCVIYESPKRILSLICGIENLDENRQIFAIKEASKKFETKFFGSAKELALTLKTANLNGEWAVVVAGAKEANFEKISENDIKSLEISPKIKAKLLAKITGKSVKEIYNDLIK